MVEKALPTSRTRKGMTAEEKHYPLWYNNNLWEGAVWGPRKKPSKKIRTELISSMIEKTNQMQTLSNIFYKSGGKYVQHPRLTWMHSA